jgi:hypothetical protein
MTITEALKHSTGYPVPDSVLIDISRTRGLDPEEQVTATIQASDKFRLANADVAMWVSFAPNISEGGVNVSLLYSDRKALREGANRVYGGLNDPRYTPPIRQTFSFEGEDI